MTVIVQRLRLGVDVVPEQRYPWSSSIFGSLISTSVSVSSGPVRMVCSRKAARRNVPVHPTLIKLGIAEEWSRFNKLSASVVSKRFTRWRKSQRVNRDRVAFHSLRKNFAESLENAHVSTNLVAALLGHSRGFSLDVYNPAGPEFGMLAGAVAKVKYRGLKL